MLTHLQKRKRNKEKLNGGLSNDILRSGYDRCRRGYVHVYGLLYEQKGERTSRIVTESKSREQGSIRDFGKYGGDGNKVD